MKISFFLAYCLVALIPILSYQTVIDPHQLPLTKAISTPTTVNMTHQKPCYASWAVEFKGCRPYYIVSNHKSLQHPEKCACA